MANYLGLESTLATCERTPQIEAWIKEERKRLATEKVNEAREAREANVRPSENATECSTCHYLE